MPLNIETLRQISPEWGVIFQHPLTLEKRTLLRGSFNGCLVGSFYGGKDRYFHGGAECRTCVRAATDMCVIIRELEERLMGDRNHRPLEPIDLDSRAINEINSLGEWFLEHTKQSHNEIHELRAMKK